MDSSAPLRRTAIVTGAAEGIGRSIALRLAEDGLNVAVNDLPVKREKLEAIVAEIKALPDGQAIAVPGDVSCPEDVERLVKSAVEAFGGLDVMVANAGTITSGPFVDFALEEWDRVIAVNLRGEMLCYKYAAKQMIKQGRGGRIIGASSQTGKQGMPNLAAYSASKFAIRGLTQCTALELAKHDITVNAYAPGLIHTNMIGHDEEIRLGLKPGTLMRQMLGLPNDTALPMAEPEVIASFVSYLAKPESRFITGQTINVNGGGHCD
ncbi:short chain oxidoreductase [Fomitopsis serialis]|uniref:short chain oxidoreductase n=1 Tax=Fomitopsis serialis TaxID=139415 RepID=UPI002007A3E7|nr:short chain oxidoreductase [Neoantrodia serialis]KAH9917303.1 short chain oxidoreductase [Neoantrodia serialis]